MLLASATPAAADQCFSCILTPDLSHGYDTSPSPRRLVDRSFGWVSVSPALREIEILQKRDVNSL